MTRLEQDKVLLPVIVAHRYVARRLTPGRDHSGELPINQEVESFRASLRLDDPKLHAIRETMTGRAWPWSSEADASISG